MSQAEDLLNSLSEEETTTYTLTPEDEPHIIVNDDRSVTVPDVLKEIAVQFDHNIETVTFDCPRYWDGHDLSLMKMYIAYQRQDGYKDSYPVDNLRVDDTDDSIIHFEWTISGNVTLVKGVVTFLVCAKLADDNGILERHWNSKPNSDFKVLEGLDCVEGMVEQNPDIIEYILAYLDTSNKASVKSVNGILPDEEGNVTLATDDDAVEVLYEMGVVDPVTNDDGTVLTDENGNIITI